MIGYTALAIEFLVRFYFQKPFASRSSSAEFSDGPAESDKPWKASDRAFLPRRLSLMVLGLALATVFVFVRFDTTFYPSIFL